MNSETFEIWQINLTDEQIEEVNSSDDMPEFFKKYTRTTFAPGVEDIYTVMNDDMYEHVANIPAMNKIMFSRLETLVRKIASSVWAQCIAFRLET